MRDAPNSSRAVVTARSLPDPSQLEAAQSPQDAVADIDPLERALLIKRYRAIVDRVKAETRRVGDDVMVTVQDGEASRLQSRAAELAIEGRPLAPGGEEVKFGTGFEGRDWFGWMASMIDHVDRDKAHPFLWSSAPAETFPESFRLAVVGDWGTSLYGAPRIAADIRAKGPFDLLLHLGDVYYSGTPEETKERFLKPWPFDAGGISRALNANHEMYSGGYAYFDITLPRFGQKASYFALQNKNWVLIGLDTAYVDHDLDPKQLAWLDAVITAAGSRRIVLFSHQQLFSRLDSQGVKLRPKLDALLATRRISAWYWGHEHQCVLYDAHPDWGLIARCLGNGGIPEPRKPEVQGAPIDRSASYVTWRRLTPDASKPWAPSCIALDGPNPDIKGRERDFVPHAYMTLEFQGPVLRERVILPDGAMVFENEIK
jgi:hypothetical protein